MFSGRNKGELPNADMADTTEPDPLLPAKTIDENKL
jgi:hypothetical protein